MISNNTLTEFQQTLIAEGASLYREMPWRIDRSPYYILVSEIMLQQTQVSRVVPKFKQFVTQFPDFTSLAEAHLGDVLSAWSGLGYNRRAKYLHQAAREVEARYDGVLPNTEKDLVTLSGIGTATAGAIMAYAYNMPSIFIETNIRTVYLHHFFYGHESVSDAEITALVERTIDTSEPRHFYWALMDYGTHLKAEKKGSITASKQYKKQSPLKGSIREVRGKILKILAHESLTKSQLTAAIRECGDDRVRRALDGLLQDGLVSYSEGGDVFWLGAPH